MEISFKTKVDDNLETKIVIRKIDNEVVISQREVLFNEESNDITTHYLCKNQLKDFIGALLHVQSKLR